MFERRVGGLPNLRRDLALKAFAGLWPWEWRLLGNACPPLRLIVRSTDDALLGLLPKEWFHAFERLRRFIVGAAERGEKRWILALLSADQDALEHMFLLHAVCRGGHAEIGRMLLRIGADPNLQDEAGVCPLHIAARVNCAELVSSSMETTGPLLYSACSFFEALDEEGAEIDAVLASSGATPLTEAAGADAAALDAGSVVDAPPGSESMPLHEAVGKGHAECVRLLLEAGAKVDASCLLRGTSLHVACRKARDEVVVLLLERRADPNALNEQGQTPLGLAFQASQCSRPARASFKRLRAKLVAAGGVLGEYNPTLYGGK
eukprot:CAMPEP_0177395418 /NCGR_PEP_ID=MMETSP0368-20130122/56138_1 /TAXON_ID=447022 ORGANISM="Scrippsiella hangoei-like, Strain SHHI-4" /NCGR_SAMPLE_ID=MMETSP0368 /ASSEMBLY_ACC=CAM_ASM_000363 /LENGTH=319 /DNA_ID=CAMNT_0018861995 /DNA_START=136 /DNA_END=1096 /DNA_ORIENTATION=-